MKQHKWWKNEYDDLVFYDGGDLTYNRWCITMDGKYITSQGGLNQAKKYINDKRGKKTKFYKIDYVEL